MHTIRIIDHEVEKSRSVLYALNLVHHFEQKGDVVDSQVPPEIIPRLLQDDNPVKIPLADILPLWVWRPHASPRCGRLVKKVVLAIEEELGETWSRDCGSVVVSEAEGVRVPVGCHVGRCVLAVVRVSRIVSGRCVFLSPAYGPLIGTIWDPSPETQYHTLSLELAAESVKLELVEAGVANVVDPRERK